MKMLILKRAIRIVVLLFGITFLSFALSFFSPGDPVEMMLNSSGGRVSEETVEKVRENMGLDRPFIVQYADWLNGVVHGDLGTSYKSKKPVAALLTHALPMTLSLTAVSMVVMIMISTPLGVACALRKDSIFDHIIRVVTYFFAALPSFFFALILLYVLALKLKIFPVIPRGPLGIIMPVCTLALTLGAWYVRQIRSMMLREMQKDYVRGLRSRGFSEPVIFFRNILKNCAAPLITLLSMSFGSMLGGAAIVESIFVWNGVGKLAVDSITARDYPMIQGYVVWMTVIFLLINILADVISRVIDPRIRREARI